MRDVELYRHLRGLEEPWTVRWVESKVAEQRVDVWTCHVEGVRWPCPEGGTELALSTTTRRNACGDTWTVASSGRICTRRLSFAKTPSGVQVWLIYQL
jgi:hypothetical protein